MQYTFLEELVMVLLAPLHMLAETSRTGLGRIEWRKTERAVVDWVDVSLYRGMNAAIPRLRSH